MSSPSHHDINRPYSVNGLNQLTKAGATTLGYDGRGNLTSSGADTYTYTAQNQLATGPGGALLAYDALGRLTQTASTAGPTIDMDYIGSQLVVERQGSYGPILRRYVYGPGDDEPLVWYEGGGTNDRRWLHADERGSVIAVSDVNGNAIAINRYDEYGIPAATNIGRFQYTGQAWLPELGLYYYKARIYSPTLGRFMQTDSIGYGDGMNLYAYVGNDPVNKVDPSGLIEDGITVTARRVSRRGWDHVVTISSDSTGGARPYELPSFSDAPAAAASSTPAATPSSTPAAAPQSSDCGRAGCQTKPLPPCMSAFLKRYYPTANVDAVRLHNGSPFGAFGNSVTFGHTINIAGGNAFYNPAGNAQHIFHEFTHVRQYEAGTLSVGGYIVDAAYYRDHDSIPTEAQAIANSAVLAGTFATSPEARQCR